METEIFSTASAAHTSPVGGWQDALRRLVALDFNYKPSGPRPFQASIRVWSSRRLRFSALSTSSHVCTYRAGVEPRSSAESYYLLAHLKEGSAVVTQDDRETFVEEGNFVVVDTSRPFQIQTPAMRAHAVDISYSRMREIFPQVDGLTATCFTSCSGPGASLRNVLDGLFTQASVAVQEEACDFMADAISCLTAGSLAVLPAARDMLLNRMEIYHRHRIRNFVRANLRNRELSPEMVARSVGLSLRSVHQLFENEPTTLMRWIWAERIARCGDELSKPTLGNRTIGEIAYFWGFNDTAHFCRLFRAQYGMSARAFRGQLAAPGAADIQMLPAPCAGSNRRRSEPRLT